MDYREFKKMVENEGFNIQFDTKHMSYIVDYKGKELCRFSISHKKGAKDFVKPIYVKVFKIAVEQYRSK